MRKRKTTKQLLDAVMEEAFNAMPKWVQMYSELQAKITRRCMIEGCVFGYELFDKEPKDECIYCGEPRLYMFPGNLGSIRKSLNKRKPKTL